MKCLLLVIACALALAACGKSPSGESAESLAANPDRLKEVMRQCKADRTEVGESLCSAASLAWRKRFMGEGKPSYTPQPAQMD